MLKDSDKVHEIEFRIKATHSSKIARSKVQIFVLPLHFGDKFAFDAINEVHKELEKDKRIPPPSVFVPAALDILLQQVAEGDPVNGISEAETIVEKTINLVHKTIIHQFGKFCFQIKAIYMKYFRSNTIYSMSNHSKGGISVKSNAVTRFERHDFFFISIFIRLENIMTSSFLAKDLENHNITHNTYKRDHRKFEYWKI